MQRTGSAPPRCIAIRKRSISLSRNGGDFTDPTITTASMLQAMTRSRSARRGSGRERVVRRGRTTSTTPLPSPRSLQTTSSPTARLLFWTVAISFASEHRISRSPVATVQVPAEDERTVPRSVSPATPLSAPACPASEAFSPSCSPVSSACPAVSPIRTASPSSSINLTIRSFTDRRVRARDRSKLGESSSDPVPPGLRALLTTFRVGLDVLLRCGAPQLECAVAQTAPLRPVQARQPRIPFLLVSVQLLSTLALHISSGAVARAHAGRRRQSRQTSPRGTEPFRVQNETECGFAYRRTDPEGDSVGEPEWLRLLLGRAGTGSEGESRDEGNHPKHTNASFPAEAARESS